LIDISESFNRKLKKSKQILNKKSDDDQDDDLIKNLIESSETISTEIMRKRKSINVDIKLDSTSAQVVDKDKDNNRDDEKQFIGFLPAQSFAQRLLEKNKQRQLKQKKYRKEHDLKLGFSEFYLSLILLQNYQTLNFTGFRKILKKHDKVYHFCNIVNEA
jgi:SPX domain protein involved in polyphosphate accumulation